MFSKLRNLFTDDSVLENEDIVKETSNRHCDHGIYCQVGDMVTLFGRINSVTLPAANAQTTYNVDINDGTCHVTAKFLGRRYVPGIDPGCKITVYGRLHKNHSGELIMWNPEYEIHVSGEFRSLLA